MKLVIQGFVFWGRNMPGLLCCVQFRVHTGVHTEDTSEVYWSCGVWDGYSEKGAEGDL